MCVAISSNNRWIVSGSFNKTILIWDIETGEELKILKGHDAEVESIAISPNNRRIISGSYDKTIRIWDIETNEKLRTLKGHERDIYCVDIDVSNQYIVSGSEDRTVRVWSIDTGEELKVLKGHKRGVTSVVMSLVCRLIASSSEDRTVRIWDINTGEELKVIKVDTLMGWRQAIQRIKISLDCRRIIITDYDTIRVWDVKLGKEIQTIEGNESDFQAITNPQIFPLKVLSQVFETEIEDKHQNKVHFSESISPISMNREGKIWMGGIDNYLCIIELEGKVDKLTEV